MNVSLKAATLLLAGLALAAADGAGQILVPRGIPQPRIPPGQIDANGGLAGYNGGFQFCRIWFRSWPNGDGDGWFVDYPRADENLSIRFSELTKSPVTHDVEGNPVTVLVRLTDPALFHCPFTMMSEPGGSYFSEEEAKQLHDYLLKGGFLWVDDFWGDRAWANWQSQIGKALSPSEYPIVDLGSDQTIFHTLFNVDHVPQVPNIGLWRNYHQTSERGEESAQVHTRAILDRRGRIMVMMTHNTDFGDAYEREAEMPEYFKTFSVTGYALGVDILLYAMTH
jgi:hypothetical protein